MGEIMTEKYKGIMPHTFTEANANKPKPKVTYSVRIQGYDSALKNTFDSITDARICRIKLVKQARQSKDKWFKGKIRPYFSSMHRIKNEWIRLSSLYITEKTTHYYWKPDTYSVGNDNKYYSEPEKTTASVERKRITPLVNGRYIREYFI